MIDYNQIATELLLYLQTELPSEDNKLMFCTYAGIKHTNSKQLTKENIEELSSELSSFNEISFKDKINKIWQQASDEYMKANKNHGITQAAIAEEVGVTKQAMSKILDFNGNTIPKKYTLVRIALAFELDYLQTIELLAYGNYAFNPGKITDKIIVFCIKKNIYNINVIFDLVQKISSVSNTDYIKTFTDEMDI